MLVIVKPVRYILYYCLENSRLAEGQNYRCVTLITGGVFSRMAPKHNSYKFDSTTNTPTQHYKNLGSINNILIDFPYFLKLILLVVLVE